MIVNNIIDIQVMAILAASTLVTVVGVVDDARGVAASTKLAVQVIAVGVVMVTGIGLNLSIW